MFLSHASADRRFASRLAATLERHGVSVWYSATSLAGSSQWQKEIGDALDSCKWFVLLGTRAACRKPARHPWWVQREVLHALNHARYEGRIVPLLKEKANLRKLAWYLPQIQYIDFQGNYHEGCAALLRLFRKKYRRT